MPKTRFRYEVYQDQDGEWRWRLRAVNNRIIAESGEGYKNRGDCIDGIQLVVFSASNAQVVDDLSNVFDRRPSKPRSDNPDTQG